MDHLYNYDINICFQIEVALTKGAELLGDLVEGIKKLLNKLEELLIKAKDFLVTALQEVVKFIGSLATNIINIE